MKHEKKKQHFVPRFYLRYFADEDNKFFRYDFDVKGDVLPNRVFYESQCYGKYFYGEDGVLEEMLSQKEGEWASVCRKAVDRKPLSDSDVTLLKECVI